MYIDRLNLTLFLAMLAFVTVGCGSGNTSTEHVDPYRRIAVLPANIRNGMDSLVISRTGRDVFATYFVLDSAISGLFPGDESYKKDNPRPQEPRFLAFDRYIVRYWFRIPDKPWRRASLIWTVDLQGTLISPTSLDQIPNCVGTGDCTFQIDSCDAIASARTAGIPEGLRPLTAYFSPFPIEGRIVWEVSSTVEQRSHPLFARDSVYFVDASTGAVVGRSVIVGIE
jgi:hypothetical protein